VDRRRFILGTLGASGLAALAGQALPSYLRRAEQKSWALGADVTLIAYHKDQAVAKRALAACFRALDRLENVLSLYRCESEICRLNREGLLDQPHPDLVKVLGSSLEWSRLTAGAFDATVQPLWELYARGRPPEASELEDACANVDWRQVRLENDRIRVAPGQAVTLNGIAQGFAADRVVEVLRAYGVEHALANTGEFGALGRKPAGDAWRIGIQHPRVHDAFVALAALDNRFLATSGDYETTFTDDFSSHHIFDPATGRSPASLASVTVLASTGLEADALSTAIFVLGPERGLELASLRPGVDVLLVLKNGDVRTTPTFPRVS
jgi:thiamine biosynthesis lipoprotein